MTLVDEKIYRPTGYKEGTTRTVKTATGEMVGLSGPYIIKIDDKDTKIHLTKGVNGGVPIVGTDYLEDRKAKIDYDKNETVLDGLIKNITYPESVAIATIDEVTTLVLKYSHLFDQGDDLPSMDVDVE